MPRIRYLCSNKECDKEFFLFIPVNKILNETKCPSCYKIAKRQLSASSTRSVVMVDNGFQTRAVELDLNVIESNKERSKKGENRGD